MRCAVEVERVDADGKRVEQLTLGEIGGQHGPTSEGREGGVMASDVEKTRPRGAGRAGSTPRSCRSMMAR